ncbi:MAG: O-antigen ligase family protein [Clostridia bacterium]
MITKNRNNFLEMFKLFQRSILYPIFIAVIVLLSSQFNLEVITVCILCVFIILTFIIGNDLITISPILFMTVMCVGQKESANWYKTGIVPYIPYIIILFALLIASIIFYLIKYKPKVKLDLQFWGLVAISASLTLGGIFYTDYNILSMLMGGAFAICFAGLYVLLKAGTKTSSMQYIARTVIVASVLMLCQIALLYIRSEPLRQTFNKGYVYMGWGVSNNFANILLVGLAFTLYYASVSKRGYIFTILSALMIVGIYFTFCRGCLLLSLPLFALGMVFALIKNQRGRLGNIICLVTMAVFVILIAIIKWDTVYASLQHYIHSGLNDSGRFKIYMEGITKIFVKEPFLGVGFMDRYLEQPPSITYFYHNTFIQFLVNCGIVGLLSYIFHRITTIIVIVKKITVDRFFLGLGLCAIIGYSFIDCSFFFFYFIFYYVVFMVAIQKDYDATINKQKTVFAPLNRRAKVLFPFVEAGLGHIMPMKAVADAFEAKYGQLCDVTRTSFYKDSNKASLVAFEQRMVEEVKRYNTLRGYGKLCFFGMHLFGKDVFMEFIMERLVKNAYADSYDLMRQFDADIVFSTHWATSYVAKRLPNPPQNILYCPDADMDMQWDIDPDLTLISVQKGRDEAVKYLGVDKDKIAVVPFAIRKEALSISLDKNENRKIIGVPLDKFTVVLVDGGYACGKLKDVAQELIKLDLPLTVIAVCGSNKQMFEELSKLKAKPNITFLPLGYCNNMLNVVGCADCFMGKSGANTIAEFCYFGVPSIITLYTTPIEKAIGQYYIKVGCAVKANTVKQAIKYLQKLYFDADLQRELKAKALSTHASYGAEQIADQIYQKLNERNPKI